MPFREGEVYRCTDENCGCELTVTRSAMASCDCRQAPTCCRGKTLTKAE